MRERIKDVLTLHTAERKGAMLLVAILLVQVYLIIRAEDRLPEDTEMTEVLARVERWNADRAGADSLEQRTPGKEAPFSARAWEPFPFDPNTIDVAGWMGFGLIAYVWRQATKPMPRGEMDYMILGDFASSRQAK